MKPQRTRPSARRWTIRLEHRVGDYISEFSEVGCNPYRQEFSGPVYRVVTEHGFVKVQKKTQHGTFFDWRVYPAHAVLAVITHDPEPEK